MTCILAYVLQKLPSRQVRRSKTNRHRRTFFFFFQRQQLQHPPVVEERGKCALEMRSIRFMQSNPIESNRINRIESPIANIAKKLRAAQIKIPSPPTSRSASPTARRRRCHHHHRLRRRSFQAHRHRHRARCRGHRQHRHRRRWRWRWRQHKLSSEALVSKLMLEIDALFQYRTISHRAYFNSIRITSY